MQSNQQPSLLSRLDDEQQAAVLSSVQHRQIIASAGSGKTHLLTLSVALDIQNGIPPTRIAAVTFTKAAATEMGERIVSLVGPLGKDVYYTTLHSFAYKIVRDFYKEKGLNPPLVLEGFEEARMVRAILERYGPDYETSIIVGEFLRRISFFKNWGVSLQDYLSLSQGKELLGRPFEPVFDQKVFRVWSQLEAEKKDQDRLNFDDMLTEALEILEEYPEVLETWQKKFDRLYVDEAQDNNFVQWGVVKYLCSQNTRVTLVGDDDQCQPPITLVTVPGGEKRRIGDLRDGDLVVSWNQRHAYIRNLGRTVKVGRRNFSGDLVRVIAEDGKSTLATPNHKFLARWTDRSDRSLNIVYLMYRSDLGYRVGWCQLFNSEGACHLGQRARLENAEAMWIVSVHDTKGDASIWESILSTRYGIPTVMFNPRPGSGGYYTQENIRRVFTASDQNGAIRCMKAYDLDPRVPFWPTPDKRLRGRARLTIFQVCAVNMKVGLFSIPNEKGEWVRVVKTERIPYEGEVFSLDVEKDETYLADGLVTHNSLYSFRAADPKQFLTFQNFIPNVQVTTLKNNYRSAPQIIAAANRLISNNQMRTVKSMECTSGISAARGIVIAKDFNTPKDGALESAALIQRLVQRGDWKYSDFGIIVRVNALSAFIEDAFIRKGIPYEIRGTAFYNRREIRLITSYLFLAFGEGDGTDETKWAPKAFLEAIRYICNVPKRYLGKAFLEEWEKRAGFGMRTHRPGDGLSALGSVFPRKMSGARKLYEEVLSLRRFATSSHSPTSQSASNVRFGEAVSPGTLQIFTGVSTGSSTVNPPSLDQLVSYVWDKFDLEKEIMSEDTEGGDAYRLENVEALRLAVGDYSSLKSFLTYVYHQTHKEVRRDEPRDHVKIMTIHGAKGLQFRAVVGFGMSNGICPHAHSIGNPTAEEEERRMEFVRITRAKERFYGISLLMSHRGIAVSRSRFVEEAGIRVINTLDFDPLEDLFFDDKELS